MHIEDKDISSKNQLLTLFLLLLFGSFGAHRFYVGKYITGIFYLIIGSTSLIINFLGFNYAFIASMVYLVFMAIDLFALYSDSFTDRKGRLVVGKSKTLVYNSLKEREQILVEEKLNNILIIVSAIAIYIIYFVVTNYVL